MKIDGSDRHLNYIEGQMIERPHSQQFVIGVNGNTSTLASSIDSDQLLKDNKGNFYHDDRHSQMHNSSYYSDDS